MARLHLEWCAAAGRRPRWLLSVERYLQHAVEHFGARRSLATIGASDLHGWIAIL